MVAIQIRSAWYPSSRFPQRCFELPILDPELRSSEFAAQPNVKIVLLTLHNSAELLRAGFTAGACGYVLKSDPDGDLVRAFDIVADGGTYITPTIHPVTEAAVLQEVNESRKHDAIALARKAANSRS
jgi:DNA-binding NarL/FixJ family response regulator